MPAIRGCICGAFQNVGSGETPYSIAVTDCVTSAG